MATSSWTRLSSGEGEVLRLDEGGDVIASLVCRTDGSGLHAATDRFQPVMSEERFGPVGNPRYREVETLGHLPSWLDEIG